MLDFFHGQASDNHREENMYSIEAQLHEVAERLAAGKKNVALTGAGISVDSGIPDFRSPGGLWERYEIAEYGTIEAFNQDPVKVWSMLAEVDRVVDRAEPNPGHLSLAKLEELGCLEGVITQNIDNLHQLAGSKNVIEFHGNTTRLLCLTCGLRIGAEEVRQHMTPDSSDFPPRCPSCDSVLKPDVVMFGEPIPDQPGRQAMDISDGADVFLVVGTSVNVAPASYLPSVAKNSGACVVEVNPEPTSLSNGLAEFSLRGGAGEILPKLVEIVTGLL